MISLTSLLQTLEVPPRSGMLKGPGMHEVPEAPGMLEVPKTPLM